ncbi:MAG: TadE/TadG family type IV pilus assembly protein [Ignavibacteriales bacterium]
MKLRFFKDKSGAAAVEFGLVAPVLVTLLVGIGTYGLEIIAYSKMREAVSAGAQYALTTSDTTSDISAVVSAAWDDKPSGATVSVSQQCVCAGVSNDCSTACANGDYPQRITTITTTQNYSELGGHTKTLTASQQVRTR